MIKLLVKISYWISIVPPMWSAVVSAVKAIDSFITAWKNYKEE